MDDEFKLCWKNFQDNIASGFQNLYDRGDLVDVTLACDGKLLQAHKIVLAICSPYFQEIFTTNPCKHPIIILKDVSFNIMLELLEFMYQGVVNVKHTELQSFMKIGQLLQIKGLATNTSSSAASTSSEKSSSHLNAIDDESHTKHPNKSAGCNSDANALDANATTKVSNTTSGGSVVNADPSSPARSHSRCHSPPPPPPAQSTTATSSPSPSPMSYVTNVLNQHNLKGGTDGTAGNVAPLLNLYQATAGSGNGGGGLNSASSTSSAGSLKRHLDAFSNDALSIYSRKQFRRSLPLMASEHSSSLTGDHNEHSASESNGAGGSTAMGDQVNPEDFFHNIPHISMVESRYDLNNLKRETEHHGPGVAAAAAAALRNTFGPAFNFEYNPYKSGGSASSCGGGTTAGAPSGVGSASTNTALDQYPNELHMPNDYSKNFGNHMDIPQISPGEHWFQGKLEFMLSQRGKPLLVHDGHTFGIQYVRKDKKYWQCNLSRKFNCKARVTTTDTGEIIVTNNEHCHTEIRQHLRKDYQRNKVMMNALINLSTNRLADNIRRSALGNLMSSTSTSATSPSAVGLHHGHHHHQQPHPPPSHHHQQPLTDNNMEQTILDLGKAAAAAAVVAASLSPHRNMPMASSPMHHVDEADGDDDDDMTPLDCGMRSMRDSHDDKRQQQMPLPPQQQQQQQQQQHNMHSSPIAGGVADTDNWKDKADTP